MPIFPFPYDDEEERRRRLALPETSMPPRLPLRTPPIALSRMPGLSESPLPEVPTPNVGLPTSTGIPGGTMGPPLRRPTRGEQVSEARDVYLRGAPGRGKSALTGALEALSRGEGLIGAAAGGLTGAISPRRLREQQFEQRVRPRIMEGFAFEDQARAQERQAEQDALNAEYRRAQIGELGRRGLPRPQRQPSPQLKLGQNRSTGRLEYYDAANPQVAAGYEPAEFPKEPNRPTAAELTIDPESGMSVEERAEKSYQDRGGDNYVFSKLPARTQQILERGTVTINGKEEEAAPDEKSTAQRAFDNAINRQRNTDLQYTRGAIRSKRVGGRQGAARTQGGITRSRSEFNSKKFPGLKFD